MGDRRARRVNPESGAVASNTMSNAKARKLTRLPILSLLGLAIALGGGPLPARAADATPPLRIRDLATDYVAFFDETAELAPQARVDALKSRFALSFPGFYDAERVKAYSTAEQYDARIAQSFADFPELRPRFERTTRSFVAMLGPAHEAFVRHFPDLAPMGEIYLLHSMGEMDGLKILKSFHY